MDANEFLEREFANVLEERLNIEKEEQEDFITHAKNQLIEDQLNELKAAKEINYVMGKKISRVFSKTLSSIENRANLKEKDDSIKPLKVKNGLISVFLTLTNVQKRNKEEAFRVFWKLHQ